MEDHRQPQVEPAAVDDEPTLEQLKEMVDEAPVRRIVDWILSESIKLGVDEAWIMAASQRYQFVVLARHNGQWSELASQTWLIMPSLLDSLRHRAGLTKVAGVTQQGRFHFGEQPIELTIHPGEHQDEAHLRFCSAGQASRSASGNL